MLKPNYIFVLYCLVSGCMYAAEEDVAAKTYNAAKAVVDLTNHIVQIKVQEGEELTPEQRLHRLGKKGFLFDKLSKKTSTLDNIYQNCRSTLEQKDDKAYGEIIERSRNMKKDWDTQIADADITDIVKSQVNIEEMKEFFDHNKDRYPQQSIDIQRAILEIAGSENGAMQDWRNVIKDKFRELEFEFPE